MSYGIFIRKNMFHPGNTSGCKRSEHHLVLDDENATAWCLACRQWVIQHKLWHKMHLNDEATYGDLEKGAGRLLKPLETA
jgi:hypothetical protein